MATEISAISNLTSSATGFDSRGLAELIRSSQAFAVSQAAQSTLSRLGGDLSFLDTQLEDLRTLRSKLEALGAASTQLRPAPANFGSAMTVVKTQAGQSHTVTLDVTGIGGLQTGDKLFFSESDKGFLANTAYFVRLVKSDGETADFRLFTTRTDALNDTNRVTLSGGGVSDITARQIIPQPGAGITALFDAYNDLQQFLSEKTQPGGSLANVNALAGLSSSLHQTLLPVLSSTDFQPVVSSAGNRQFVLDEAALEGQIAQRAQSIASLFEGSGGIAEGLSDWASSTTVIVDHLVSTRERGAGRIEAQLAALTDQVQETRDQSEHALSQMVLAMNLNSLQIQFLSSIVNR